MKKICPAALSVPVQVKCDQSGFQTYSSPLSADQSGLTGDPSVSARIARKMPKQYSTGIMIFAQDSMPFLMPLDTANARPISARIQKRKTPNGFCMVSEKISEVVTEWSIYPPVADMNE